MNTIDVATTSLDAVRKRCCALPEIDEGETHGAPTWFIRRRSFAKFIDPRHHPRLDEEHVALWAAAPPGVRRELIAEDPRRFFAPQFGGSDWIGVRLDTSPDWEEVGELLTDAYRLHAPKRLVALLDPD